MNAKQTNSSNQEIIKTAIGRHPGLRFHQIKKETKLANGTLQHHLTQLTRTSEIKAKYVEKIPRYYIHDVEEHKQIILLRLRQNTTSKIIMSLLKNECQTFSQMVKYTKKTPGTVSVYKNMLLRDNIVVGDTGGCSCTREVSYSKIKYRLNDPNTVRLLVEEYGKAPLKKSADNLADIFLSIK